MSIKKCTLPTPSFLRAPEPSGKGDSSSIALPTAQSQQEKTEVNKKNTQPLFLFGFL